MTRTGRTLLGVALLAVGLPAVPASAQIWRPPDPQDLGEPRQAPLTFTPSITVGEEFNDNVFLDNDRKVSDFITTFTPGLAVEVEEPTYRLSASYRFAAEIFAKETQLNHAFERQQFDLDAFYRPTPRWTLTLTDRFAFSTDTNLVAVEGVSTGRDESWSNGLAGGATYEIDPRTRVFGNAGWTVLRFDSSELEDSDTVRADIGLERAFTPRLRGVVEYEVAHFSFETQDSATTHTPRVGAVYRVSETLTGSLRLGPTFEVTDGHTNVLPSVIASLRQRTRWGSLGFDYTHYVGTAGGLGGTTRNHSIGGSVQVTTLLKGLLIELAPRYSIVNSKDDRIDVDSFTLPLQVAYRFATWAALVGRYQFFHQRSDSRVVTAGGFAVAADADQNRVFIGLEFGAPIRVD